MPCTLRIVNDRSLDRACARAGMLAAGAGMAAVLALSSTAVSASVAETQRAADTTLVVSDRQSGQESEPALNPVERRKALDAMVKAAFPTAIMDGLLIKVVPDGVELSDGSLVADGVPAAMPESDASSGGAATDDIGSVASVVKDQAVLFVSFDPTDAASVRAANLAQRAMGRYAEHGVRVIGVVAPTHAEALAALHEYGEVDLVTALDSKGAFADHVLLDGGAATQYTVIDHAHTVRAADVSPRHLKTLLTRLANEGRERAAEALRGAPQTDAGPKSNSLLPGNPLGVLSDGSLPATAEAYATADWPSHNAQASRSARDVQGQPLPVPLGGEQWLTAPVPSEGRVVVLDFWATWCGPCLAVEPRLEQIQRAAGDSLILVGVSGQARGSSYPEDEATIRRFLDRKPEGPAYSHAHDPDQRVYRSLGVRAIPHAVILSSDGVVRWQGNPGSGGFATALAQVMRVDPGLAAVMAAEE